jgi:hypothetical protein
LRYFSGVQIKDYGGMGGLKTVNIRSMGSQHVGVFYDGIQLGNAQNGQVDLGRYSLDDLEEISLYNGQKSEIFQPAKDFGSSGSIYLQPKTPVFAGNRKTNLTIRAKSASIDLFNPSFRLEQKISKELQQVSVQNFSRVMVFTNFVIAENIPMVQPLLIPFPKDMIPILKQNVLKHLSMEL